ncbi:15247_t:CDS:2 [Cetraspora pellucida]|uniref:15247_t:CDS:1 n=1 Tax=Cetraspora pellucida TaxID=1433469 RepID=A0ACA9NSE2_9GLOM|nr:15247_t:CDS:2 [Cetraspora pellucida]
MRAFFDDLNALAFVLYPIKIAISTLESRDCSLANCFIGLVYLRVAIRRLPENDYHNFRQQAIAIYNRRFTEFDDDAYILCFFLHSGYTANKLFSVTPHAAECERIWSTLGWYYGKRHTQLSLSKIKNMQKLSAFYLANSKKELLYFSVNNSAEDLYEALSNINLSDDDDYNKEQPTSEVQDVEFPEEETLNIEELLNLDAADFTNDLDEIVFNNNFKSSEKKHGNVQINNAKNNVDGEN